MCRNHIHGRAKLRFHQYFLPLFVFEHVSQVLSYMIYQKINVKKKPNILQTINPKSKRKNNNDIQIFTNEGGLTLQTNIVLNPLYSSKHTVSRTYNINTNIYNLRINNINFDRKYLLFLPVNADVKNANCEYIKCHQYLFFYIQNKNYISIELTNVLNKTISDSKLLWLDNFNSDYNDKFRHIFTSPYKMIDKSYLIGKLIAVWQRTLLLTNILDEEDKMKIDFDYCNILGYSNVADINYITKNLKNKNKTFYFYTPNDTLGLKWQHLVEFTKLCNINNILIQGSDDKILLDKLNKQLINSYNFNGQRQWYIHDTVKNNFYLLTLKYLIMRGALYLIGAGRIINKTEVIKYNYNLFNPQSFKGLDHQINTIAIKIPNKIIGEPICCSLKGKHRCLNSLPKYLNSENNTYELVKNIY